MKMILEFSLPEEQEEANVALKGADLYLSFWDLDQKLRSKVKYNSEGHSEDTLEAFDKVRSMLREILEEHSCNLEMMS